MDQYLNFKSHHPLHQKLGVVRTLLAWSNKIVTEETDKATEETTIKKALQNCGYPDWSFNKVKQQMQAPKREKATKNKKDGPKSCDLAIIPFLEVFRSAYPGYTIVQHHHYYEASLHSQTNAGSPERQKGPSQYHRGYLLCSL